MEVKTRLIGLVQRLDLRSDSCGERRLENILELEVGEEAIKISAPLSEADAEKILRLSVGAPAFPDAVPSPYTEPAASDLPSLGISEALQVHTPVSPTARPPATSYAASYAPPRTGRSDTPPVRTVPADEMGNPIAPASRVESPEGFIVDDLGVAEA